MSDEISESGSPIHRYKPRESDWTPPNMEDNALEAISDHIEKHIGPIATVWHEIMSDLVHIDVHQIAPTEERPFWTLVTSGMSDLPMNHPARREEWAHAELMLCLPADWKMTETDFKDERYYWPIRWLKSWPDSPMNIRRGSAGVTPCPTATLLRPFTKALLSPASSYRAPQQFPSIFGL